MKFIQAFGFLFLVSTLYSFSEAQTDLLQNGINIKQLTDSILSFLRENDFLVSLCAPGFKAEVTEDYLKCVQDELNDTEKESEDTAEEENSSIPPSEETSLADTCPSNNGCPSNPTCNPGDHLVQHENNCCCVNEDIAKENSTTGTTEAASEDITTSLAPECPSSTSCLNNVHCISGFHLIIHEDNCCCVKEDIPIVAQAST